MRRHRGVLSVLRGDGESLKMQVYSSALVQQERVWLLHGSKGWLPGEVSHRTGNSATVILDDTGEVCTLDCMLFAHGQCSWIAFLVDGAPLV